MTRQQHYLWLSESAAVYAPNDRVIQAVGDDARSWLSGQVTNDIRGARADHAVYALAVTVKGRILTDGWVRDLGTDMALVVPAERVDAAVDSFDKHIIMEDVELKVDSALRVLTVQGPRSRAVLDAAGMQSDAYETARFGAGGFDLWVSETQFVAVREKLLEAARSVGGGEVDDAGWAYAHVLSAQPRCGVDFGDDTYPQEAGLKGRAVSFNKGCYLGQEVICMLENRGQLARRLVQLEATDGSPVEPGTLLQDLEGKRVGEITSSAVTQAGSGPTYALGYVKRPLWDVGSKLRSGDRSWSVRAVVGVTTDECPIVAR